MLSIMARRDNAVPIAGSAEVTRPYKAQLSVQSSNLLDPTLLQHISKLLRIVMSRIESMNVSLQEV
jgi:hypothetical protein